MDTVNFDKLDKELLANQAVKVNWALIFFP